MRNITEDQCGNTEEVCGLFRTVFANQEQLEAKIMQLDKQMEEKATKSWVGKLLKPKEKGKEEKKGSKMKSKGSILTRTLASIMLIAVIAGLCFAVYVPTDINYDIASNPESLSIYLRDSFSNITSNSFLFTPTNTAPKATEGKVYYKESASTLYLYTGSAWEAIDVAGGLSLDGAYDVSRTITADNGAVAISNTDDDAAFLLTLSAAPATGSALGGLEVTLSGNSTEAAIEIENAGSGDDITWTAGGGVTNAGVGTFAGLIVGSSDITLTNGAKIDNDDIGEITFSDGSDDTAISWSGTTLEWTTDSGIDTVDWGNLDVHTGFTDITGDATDFTISHTGSGAGKDLLITQSGAGDNALTLTSAGTASDAIGLVSSAGITMTSTVEASAWTQTATGIDDDLTISVTGTYDASLILSSAGTGADAISIFTSHANGDIKILSTDTIDIDAANGIAVDIAGESGQDFVLTNSGGSIHLIQTEVIIDGINIDATGGVDIDSALDVAIDISTATSNFDVDVAGGSIYLDAGEEDARAIWLAATGTASGIDIDAGTVGLDVDTSGPIVLTSTENATDSIIIQSTIGGIDIRADASDGDAIDISNADGPINITSTHDQAATINIATSNGAGQIQITSADTSEDGIEIDSAGGFDLDAADIITIDNSGGGKDITITSALGRVVITGTESADSAVEIIADGAAGGVTIDAETSGITLTATVGDITITNTGAKDIILTAQAGRVLITGTEDAAESILLDADGAGGEIALKAKTGGIDMDVVGGGITLDTSGASQDIKLDADSGAVIIDGGETGATAVVIDASHNDGGIDMDFGTGGFSLVGGSGNIVMTVAGNSGDVITLTTTTGTGTAAIALVATAGGVEIDAAAGKIIALDGGTVKLSSKTAGAGAIELVTAIGAAETILITNTSGTGAAAVNITATLGGITIDAKDDLIITNHTNSSEDDLEIVVDGDTDSSIVLDSDGSGADAILISATHATTGGIAMNFKSGNMTIIGSGVSADFILDADLISLDATGSSNITVAADAGSEDLTISQTGAQDAHLILYSTGTSIDSIYIHENSAGTIAGIKIHADKGATYADAAASITLLSDDGGIGIKAAGLTQADAIVINAVAGGVNIDAATSYDVAINAGQILIEAEDDATSAISLKTDTGSAETIVIVNTQGITADAINIDALAGGINITTGLAALAIRLDATGTVSGNAIEIETTSGSIQILADHSEYGDIFLDAEDDVQITVGGHFRIVDDDLMSYGTDDDVTFNYDENGENNLQIKGPVEFETTYVKFNRLPMFSAWQPAAPGSTWGGAATGTAGDENVMMFPEATFIYHILGDNTAEFGPQMRVGGFDISFEDAANEGVEIVGAEPLVGGGKDNFKIGTDAFYLKVEIEMTDASGTDDLFIGFREVGAFQPNVNDYDTYAMIGIQVNATIGDYYTETEENGGGGQALVSTDIDTTDWDDNQTHILEIYVSSGKAVTYKVDGTAPGNAQAFTWADTDTVVPFLFFLHHTDIAEETYLVSWECGLQ